MVIKRTIDGIPREIELTDRECLDVFYEKKRQFSAEDIQMVMEEDYAVSDHQVILDNLDDLIEAYDKCKEYTQSEFEAVYMAIGRVLPWVVPQS